MKFIEMRPKGQVTLPAEARVKLHIKEGDLLEVVEMENGIYLKPKKLIDAQDAWFWSKEWQKAEQEAQADISEKSISGPFKNAAQYRSHIQKLKKAQ